MMRADRRHGKQEGRDWALRWLSTNGAFAADDNGKFVVRVHDVATGRYNFCLVNKQKGPSTTSGSMVGT